MATAKIQLICFDLGGVLVRTATDWVDACDRAGVRGVPAFFESWTPQRIETAQEFEAGRLEPSALFDQIAAESPDHTPQQIESIIDAWIVGLYPGVGPLLNRIGEAGMMSACLSNTNVQHWRAIQTSATYEALRGLDHWFASHLIGARKPDVTMYQHIEHTLGVLPAEIVFFDDLIENIDAAKQRGWLAHQVNDSNDPVAQIEAVLDQHGFGPRSTTIDTESDQPT